MTRQPVKPAAAQRPVARTLPQHQCPEIWFCGIASYAEMTSMPQMHLGAVLRFKAEAKGHVSAPTAGNMASKQRLLGLLAHQRLCQA